MDNKKVCRQCGKPIVVLKIRETDGTFNDYTGCDDCGCIGGTTKEIFEAALLLYEERHVREYSCLKEDEYKSDSGKAFYKKIQTGGICYMIENVLWAMGSTQKRNSGNADI